MHGSARWISLFLILLIVGVCSQVIFDAHEHSQHRRVANRKVERKSTENLVKSTPEWKEKNPPKAARSQSKLFAH